MHITLRHSNRKHEYSADDIVKLSRWRNRASVALPFWHHAGTVRIGYKITHRDPVKFRLRAKFLQRYLFSLL